ncbi:unnamed protein product [Bursaphelenchus okinawaensis]|uniref:SSD domain-containing protein n=1 Tax=Bursaphelenchus okinawaensis TaxID=465554 RepID=A0A811L5Y3_9BILA|nr:unnamed protein product [Bursaphelenchus okinawaensis]CAG9120024.1 unnamed protein product [Bursaphelenchus okinawaensis]
MSICNSNIGLQLKNYILEKDLTRDKSPVYVSAILNIPMSNGYDVDYYQDIHTALLDEFNDKITRQISYDCALATVSVLVVLMGVLLYTTNFILTIATFVCMMLSIGFAFFVYIFVCNINFFPFLNLLVIVISIVIGFDDLFLLVNHYRHYKSFYANGEAMINALEHCGKGMFVTSATTAAAFVCNLQSNILILKCFGVFAGLTIIANYIFAVTALPSLILLTDKINCKSQKLIARCMIFNRIRIFFVYHIPNVIYNYRKVIVFLAWLLLIISTLITVKYITLPQNNPMQLLRSDHLFEWFSEYNSDLFDYSYQGNRQMNIYVIWGVKPAQKVPLLDPRKFGEFTTDNTFKIDSLKDLQQFKDTLLYSKAVVNYKSATYDLPLWIEEFTEFVEEKNGTNFVLQDLLEEYVQYTPTFKFPDDYSMSIKDGPLFDHDNNFISYFIILPTHHSLSFSYKDIASFMITVRKLESKLRNKDEYSNPIVSPIPFISKMADLMNVIMVNTMVSVLISVVICMLVIFATTKDVKLAVISIWTIIIVVMGVVAFVLLLGWTINVVEAVIIVITIGLSFDYTLHVAVCFKSTPKYLSIPERISRTLELIFTPIFLSALTSALAGVVLLFSGTQPFYEIGVFLGTMASISFGGAVFGFCACVSYTN